MPLPSRVDSIERQLVRERVYTILRDWIVHGTLQPNERLRDVELARQLGVSRTPVREALLRLADEGLVQTVANRWTRVSPIHLGDAQWIYPIIWSLESLAMRSAGPWLKTKDLREMEQCNDRLRRALKEKDPIAASKADRDFHFAFVRRSQNPELISILQGLKMKLRRIEVAYFGGSIVAERSVIEHEHILRALKKGDIEAAAEGVEANWRNSLERIVRSIGEKAKGSGSGLKTPLHGDLHELKHARALSRPQ